MGTTLPGQLESQWSLTFEVRKRVLSVGNWYLPTMSQWSLTFEVRKRQHHGSPPGGGAHWSQWSLTFEARKRFLGAAMTLIILPSRNGA